MADEAHGLKSMRGMAIRPVNPQKVTSMVGRHPDGADEFQVTRLTSTRPDVDGAHATYTRDNRRLNRDDADGREAEEDGARKAPGDRRLEGQRGNLS